MSAKTPLKKSSKGPLVTGREGFCRRFRLPEPEPEPPALPRPFCRRAGARFAEFRAAVRPFAPEPPEPEPDPEPEPEPEPCFEAAFVPAPRRVWAGGTMIQRLADDRLLPQPTRRRHGIPLPNTTTRRTNAASDQGTAQTQTAYPNPTPPRLLRHAASRIACSRLAALGGPLALGPAFAGTGAHPPALRCAATLPAASSLGP